jgi:hypothetical protein
MHPPHLPRHGSGFRTAKRRLIGVAAAILWPIAGTAATVSPLPGNDWASTAPASVTPALLCRSAIAGAELSLRIPDLFLSAIGRVESGRTLPATGQVAPWPWTVDAEGQGSFYATKAEAIAAVQALQARGVRSIDVGCLQVNLLQHPDAFGSLEEAFDPRTNANYAARLLQSLFVQTGSWPLAAAAYHSQTASLGVPYQQKVLAAWAMPDRPNLAGAQPPLPPKAQAAAAMPVRPAPGNASRILRTAPGAEGAGRTLDFYRRYPVVLALRPRHAS